VTGLGFDTVVNCSSDELVESDEVEETDEVEEDSEVYWA
jgi:hypothetical protein